ncbi:MAG TPA: sialate O-acetylesterase [Terriglobales bacterium]|nr:sialate O-acetylesterase [Terriglobales bacterium]
MQIKFSIWIRLAYFLSPLFLFISTHAWADPVLPHLLSDHMVVQQQREIHIWGRADSNEEIVVTLAGQDRATQADAGGNWSVELPPMQAGGPYTISIKGKREIILKDVMVGEVWVASGQSNMTFALSGSTGAAEEIPKADYPQLRLFTVPKMVATQPQQDTLSTAWQICTPETAKEFSAVAYYFARDLHRKLKVPIGIIESAWPGTAIEEWMAPDALARIEKPASRTAPVAREPFNLQFDDFQLIRAGNAVQHDVFSNFDDGTSRDSTGGNWSYSWDSAPDTSFELVPNRPEHGYAAQVAGALDASDDSRLVARFHLDDSPADLSSYDGIRFRVRGDGSFRALTLQPTITDWDDYGTQLIHAGPEWKEISISFKDLRQDGWGVVKELTPSSLSGLAIECLPSSGYPPRPNSGLYEGMIAPILPYPFRGAIWYQGEGNALDAYRYRKLLPGMIENWRDATQQNFPFLIVQLPNHGAIPEQPADSAWAELREAQLLTAKEVPNTGLAVTIDVGEPKNLHPPRKAEVGERLALWALGTTYQKQIVYSGPIYRKVQVEGNQIKVDFDHVAGGLAGGPDGHVKGFAIAGPDRKFYWADAVIQGDTVMLSSREVPQPVAVRYAWGDSPICNLHNVEGLPASPFRTDDWPGITLRK